MNSRRLTAAKMEWFGNIRGDVLAGLVVALALVPEAIAFAFVAGVEPLVGLYAAFIVGLITAVFGGLDVTNPDTGKTLVIASAAVEAFLPRQPG